MPRSPFHGKAYRYCLPDSVQTIGVCQIVAGKWAACWVSDTGGRHRVRSGRLPVMDDPYELQALFEVWASQRELKEVTTA